MFDEATEECQNLLNKTISANGVTRFKFVLDQEVIQKCGIKNEETEEEDSKDSIENRIPPHFFL